MAYNFSQGDAIINLPSGVNPYSIDITNTTYTAQSITQGDQFAAPSTKVITSGSISWASRG